MAPAGPRIADAHNDLLMELAWRAGEERPFERHWLGKLEAGNVGLQVCALYPEVELLPEGALRQALLQAAQFRRAALECADRVLAVRTRADLDAVERGERIGLVLAMEGVEPLGVDPGLADVFHELGVRMVALTWNRRNHFADGLGEPAHGGLSALGRELVDRLLALGTVLDLAHASERTFADVLERSGGAPVVVSHAACRALCDTPRNVSDDQLRAIAATGGVLGLMALPLVIDPQRPTIERLVDHVDHAVEVAGIEHVALGGDFVRQLFRSGAVRGSRPQELLLPAGMALDASLEGLSGPEHYGLLVEALRARGYEGARLEAILAGNLLRVLRAALA